MKKKRGIQYPVPEYETQIQSTRASEGIFLVRVSLCEAFLDNFDGWSVTFKFEGLTNFNDGKTFQYTLGNGPSIEEKGLLCRVFAVMGVSVWEDADLALACREVVGRHVFLHANGGYVHVLQLATTHSVAMPEGTETGISPEDGRPALSHDQERDMSDPKYPRFHSCDVMQKADLRLHDLEHKRARRARVKRED